jgi:microcystin degradation protein MlrC
MKRIGIGKVSHETHGFAPSRTRLEDFVRYKGNEIVEAMSGSDTCLGGCIEGAQKYGMQILPLYYAGAVPAGLVEANAFKNIVDELINSIKLSLPLDGIVMDLHGAMLAEGCDDCEGYLLKRIRELAGNIPIIATLDLHSNTSENMVRHADVLIPYRQNPHLDKKDRGLEAMSIMKSMTDGMKVYKYHIKLPLLLSPLTTWTEGYPLKSGCSVAETLRKNNSIVSIGITGGYCYADTDITGVSVMVYTNAALDDGTIAKTVAEEISVSIWEKRHAAKFCGFPLEDTVSKAVFTSRSPVVLADIGDNVGGGSPGDGTLVLESLIRNGAVNATVTIADPESVLTASKAGIGSTVELILGGKADGLHGKPLLLTCVVENVTDGTYTIEGNSHFGSHYGGKVNMGLSAVVNHKGIRILINEKKTGPGDLGQLRSQGIIPEEQHIIVAKSAVAFRGGYEKIASEIFEVNTGGLCTCDLKSLPLKKSADRLFPLNPQIEWNKNKARMH